MVVVNTSIPRWFTARFLLGAALLLTACGGDNGVTSGVTCETLCPAIAACAEDSAENTDCATACEAQRSVFNAPAWDAYTACVQQPACVSAADCLGQAAAGASKEPVDKFLNEVCDWAVGCGQGFVDRAQCRTLLESIGQDDEDATEISPWDFIALIRNSTLDCMTDCISHLSCTEADFGGASQSCMSNCGLTSVTGESGSGGSGSSADYCVEMHGDCGDFGTMTENEYGGCECQCDPGTITYNYVCVGDCTQTGCGEAGTCDVTSGYCQCDEGYFSDLGSANSACQVSPTFVDLGAADRATCALRQDGRVECWGSSVSTPLGAEIPADVALVSLDLGGGLYDTIGCGLRQDQTVFCWGDLTAPVGTFLSLSVGESSACGVLTDNTLQCWGSSFSGLESPPQSAGVAQVAVGSQLACALLLDGSVTCWGSANTQATDTTLFTGATALSVGARSGCVIMPDTSVQCFGADTFAQEEVPLPNSGFIDVSCSDDFSCAVRQDTSVVCWGRNIFGQLAPEAGSEVGFTDVECGADHTCGLQQDGSLRCWGYNVSGEAQASRTAVRVLDPPTL